MPAILVSTTEAVVTALNTATPGTFSQTFEAERSYADWALPLEDSDPHDKVLVDVVPVGINYETELETRGSITYSPAVDVVMRLRLGPEKRQPGGKFTLAEIDALVLFVEEINEYFTAERLAAFTDAVWDAETGNKILSAYVPSHLRQHHQFTGRVRIPFVTTKALA